MKALSLLMGHPSASAQVRRNRGRDGHTVAARTCAPLRAVFRGGPSLVVVLLAAGAFLLAAAPRAEAYVDPNASSLIFQFLSPVIALAVGVLVFLRDTMKRWIARLCAVPRVYASGLSTLGRALDLRPLARWAMVALPSYIVCEVAACWLFIRHFGLRLTLADFGLTALAGLCILLWVAAKPVPTQRPVADERDEAEELLDTYFLLAAAVLLILPGLLADWIGLLLLIPRVRRRLCRIAFDRFGAARALYE